MCIRDRCGCECEKQNKVKIHKMFKILSILDHFKISQLGDVLEWFFRGFLKVRVLLEYMPIGLFSNVHCMYFLIVKLIQFMSLRTQTQHNCLPFCRATSIMSHKLAIVTTAKFLLFPRPTHVDLTFDVVGDNSNFTTSRSGE